MPVLATAIAAEIKRIRTIRAQTFGALMVGFVGLGLVWTLVRPATVSETGSIGEPLRAPGVEGPAAACPFADSGLWSEAGDPYAFHVFSRDNDPRGTQDAPPCPSAGATPAEAPRIRTGLAGERSAVD